MSLLVRTAGPLLLLIGCSGIAAQTAPAPDTEAATAPSYLDQVPQVPGFTARLRGLNAGVTLSGVHDSSVGWYTLLTPAAGYSFSRRYSVDATLPIYLHRLVQNQTTTTSTQPGPPGSPPQTTTRTTLVALNGVLGDMAIAAHANFRSGKLQDTLSASLTVPTGDSDNGLSTGHVTFDLSNHTEYRVKPVSFVLDLGGGDSASLVNRLVTKDYTTLGPLAHFQAGLNLTAPYSISFETIAYEQLPIGDQKLYTTLTRPGFPNRAVVSGRSVSEDNGFTNSLNIPLTSHLTLSGYYNRSLRLHIDTAATSLTYVLRGTHRKRKLSDIDRALQE